MAQISFTPSLFGSLPSKISLREGSQKLKNSLSLHLRGTVRGGLQDTPPHRFISAPAGNTVKRLPRGVLGTDYPREVIEAALAHVVRNRVEAAYARSDLFERRRVLMDDWARYLDQGMGCPHQVRQGDLAQGRPGIEPHPQAHDRQGQVNWNDLAQVSILPFPEGSLW